MQAAYKEQEIFCSINVDTCKLCSVLLCQAVLQHSLSACHLKENKALETKGKYLPADNLGTWTSYFFERESCFLLCFLFFFLLELSERVISGQKNRTHSGGAGELEAPQICPALPSLLDSTPSAFSGLSGLRACFSVSVLPSTGETAKRPPGVTNLLQLREAQPQCEALYDVGHVPYRLTLAGGPVPLSCRCDVAYAQFERCCSASECGREHGRKPEAIRVSAGVGALGTQFSSAPPLVLFCYYQSGVRASFYQRC